MDFKDIKEMHITAFDEVTHRPDLTKPRAVTRDPGEPLVEEVCIFSESRSSITQYLALALVLARLARRISRVALELALSFQRRLAGELLGMGDFARDRLGLENLFPCALISRQFGRQLCLGDDLQRLTLRDAQLARFNNCPSLGFALDDGGIVGIVFRLSKEFLRKRFLGVRGGSLSISKAISVKRGHLIPLNLLGRAVLP
jgi:hypothetical protein